MELLLPPAPPPTSALSSRMVCYAFRLHPEQELKAALAEFTSTKKIKAGFILSCVGSVKDVSLRLSGASSTHSRPGIQATIAGQIDHHHHHNHHHHRQQQDGEQPMLHTGPDARFEIVSLVGTLSPDGLHLHTSLSDEGGGVCGGHLVRATVHTTAEVVIGVSKTLTFAREMDPATGFKELVVSGLDENELEKRVLLGMFVSMFLVGVITVIYAYVH